MRDTWIRSGLSVLTLAACAVASCSGDSARTASGTSAKKHADSAAVARRFGYLVLPAGATKFGLRPGDTLEELRPSGALRALTDPHGHPNGTRLGPFDNRCTRYFAATPDYVVVQYYQFCPEDDHWISDNIIVFEVFKRDSTGAFRIVVRPEMQGADPYPIGRAIDGRPIQLGQQPRHPGS